MNKALRAKNEQDWLRNKSEEVGLKPLPHLYRHPDEETFATKADLKRAIKDLHRLLSERRSHE